MHLRTPGQEHKEDLETGTRAAAAGGYCAVVAMPNTDPVLDEPGVLRGLLEQARLDARVPVGAFGGDQRRPRRRAPDRDGAGCARRARSASPTTASRSSRRACCAARCATSGCAAA